MSDNSEIVDFDECSVMTALLVGGAVAFVLTVNPLGAFSLFLAGVAGATAFIFKHQVRLELKHAMKVGILACLAGFGVSIVVYDFLWLAFDYRVGMEFNIEFVGQFMDPLADGSSEPLQDRLDKAREAPFGFATLVQQILGLFVMSGIGGAIGGALASVFFKKFRLAQ